MACSAAVEDLVEVEQCLHDHDQASRGQISPNRLCHVCGPLAEMAPDHSKAITRAHYRPARGRHGDDRNTTQRLLHPHSQGLAARTARPHDERGTIDSDGRLTARRIARGVGHDDQARWQRGGQRLRGLPC